jgi:hypothetical protein
MTTEDESECRRCIHSFWVVLKAFLGQGLALVPGSLGLVILLETQPQFPRVAVVALLAHGLQVNLSKRNMILRT